MPPRLAPEGNGPTSVGSALQTEVVLIAAPAAVGKSMLANQIAAERGLPLLDLAVVPVSTSALVGLLQTDVRQPGDPLFHFHRGELPVIVDALDEGRLLSGEQNFEEFLKTLWEFMSQDRAVTNRPKLVMLGRNETIDLVATSIALYGPALNVTRFEVSFFDEDGARQLIDAYARSTSLAGSQYSTHLEPAQRVVDAYFAAIEAALGLQEGHLWVSAQGRAFAGYAPVLAALGSLLARIDNYMDVRNRLLATGSRRSTGIGEAWDVIELVALEILAREQRKLCDALRPQVKEDLPAQTYDPYEQLSYLSRFVHNDSPRQTGRVTLPGADMVAYHRLAEQYLPEHPFVRGREFSNAVLGSMVLAHAVAYDLLGTMGSEQLRDLSRQPFLWRSFRRLLNEGEVTLLDGRYVGCILNSMWSDPVVDLRQVSITSSTESEGAGQLIVQHSNAERWKLELVLPVELYGQVRDCDIDLAGQLICRGHDRGDGPSSFYVRGAVALVADKVTLATDRINLYGRIWLAADKLEHGDRLVVQVAQDAEIGFGGEFRDRYPWNRLVATVSDPDAVRPRGDDVLFELVDQCWQKLPGVLTLNHDYSVTDDRRVRWVKRQFPEEFPKLIKLMVEKDLAHAETFASSGQTKIRVHFTLTWSDLRDALEDPEQAGSRIAEFVAEAHRRLRSK